MGFRGCIGDRSRNFILRGRFRDSAAGPIKARRRAHVAQIARVKRLKPFRRGAILVCCESLSHAIGPSSV